MPILETHANIRLAHDDDDDEWIILPFMESKVGFWHC
jgi:hypothetical protein